MWLGWLASEGIDRQPPSPDLVCDYIEHLEGAERHCSPVTVASYIYELWVACRLIWPAVDWNWLGLDAELLAADAEPSRDKALRVIPIDELYAYGISLMREAMAGIRTPGNAIQFRDGYFLALASLRPKRVSNLANIIIGRNLITDFQGIPVQLHFAKTKNGDPSTWPYPTAQLGTFHRTWIEVFRPILLGSEQDEGHLWLNRDGEPLSSNAIWRQLRKRTGEAFPGRSIGPHMIRTCYATSFAEEDGTLLPMVSANLDHKDPRSIEPYQTISASVAAAKTLEERLRDLRNWGIDDFRRRNRRRSRGAQRSC